jgi:predicted translin family RNA/ssDNA-binding protein
MDIYDVLVASFKEYGLIGENDKGSKNSAKSIFERRRSATPKAHGSVGDVRNASKDLIDAVRNGNSQEEINSMLEEMKSNIRGIYDLTLRPGQAEQFIATAGKEYVEAGIYVYLHAHVIRGEPLPEKLPGPAHFMVPEEVWLWGIGEALTEIERTLNKLNCRPDFTLKDRIALRERYLEFLRDAELAMSIFEHEVPATIDLPQKFGASYRFNLIPRIRAIIRDQEARLAEMYDRLATK